VSKFLDQIKADLIAEGLPPDLFSYLEDRIAEIVADKLSQAIGDLEEKLTEDLTSLVRKRT
jgi:hypothetical protein